MSDERKSNPPRVSEQPVDEHSAKCLYATIEGDPTCGEPATFHVLIGSHNANGDMCSLPSCDTHLPVAIAVPNSLQTHRYGIWCGMPGALWNISDNECFLDDSGGPDVVPDESVCSPFLFVLKLQSEESDGTV